MPPHTERRGNRVWYRRRVPSELIPFIGRAEYRESLKTSDTEVARTRAALRDAAVAIELEQARAKLRAEQAGRPSLRGPLTAEDQRYIAEAVRSVVLDEDERVRMERPSEETLEVYDGLRSDQYEEVTAALPSGRVAVGPQAKQEMVRLLHSVGLSVAPDSPAWNVAAFKATD